MKLVQGMIARASRPDAVRSLLQSSAAYVITKCQLNFSENGTSAWNTGRIKEALPSLTPAIREHIITDRNEIIQTIVFRCRRLLGRRYPATSTPLIRIALPDTKAQSPIRIEKRFQRLSPSIKKRSNQQGSGVLFHHDEGPHPKIVSSFYPLTRLISHRNATAIERHQMEGLSGFSYHIVIQARIGVITEKETKDSKDRPPFPAQDFQYGEIIQQHSRDKAEK